MNNVFSIDGSIHERSIDIDEMSVLFVEDSIDDLNFYGQTLSGICSAHFAVDVDEAISFFASGFKPHLLVLDIHLPKFDGLKLLHKLQQNYELESTRVIVVTSQDHVDWCIKAYEAGVHDYIRKPVPAEELQCRIKFHLMQVKQNIQQRQLAYHDQLTQIANRRTFDIELEKQCRHAQRHNIGIACLMIDIDFFEQYNDTYGHIEGDRALIEVAQFIKQYGTRATDIAARYGGEEFCLLLPGCTKEGAFQIAESLRINIKMHVEDITVSIGIGLFEPQHNDRSDALPPEKILVQQADEALYQAKMSGRNCVKLYQHITQKSDKQKV